MAEGSTRFFLGAAVGAVTAKGGNRVKNGVIGAVAGSVLGGVIGNNQKQP